ncbi:hypothetical protein [Undibacterium terreum]|uniref:Peptidase M50B-like n=1 Tax=Undibacterium terreum TaxID=1224302 RepID=A0A916UE33_9BURK|nr:hypothetical protein [Undibacterium terreum]GGC69017.1 hypothetical protein GCM10011396_15060 [Undibacterium terreum]
MSFFHACTDLAPAYLCKYQDLAIYLLPSALLALLIRFLSARYPVFFLFTLAGTISHEAAHFLVGLLTGARPVSFSVIPRRSGNSWELGSVALSNLRWYNAAPAALAPFLIIIIPIIVAFWRTQAGLKFELFDIALAFALAPQFLSFWPSWVDWKLAVRSWPYLVFAAAGWWLMAQGPRFPA